MAAIAAGREVIIVDGSHAAIVAAGDGARELAGEAHVALPVVGDDGGAAEVRCVPPTPLEGTRLPAAAVALVRLAAGGGVALLVPLAAGAGTGEQPRPRVEAADVERFAGGEAAGVRLTAETRLPTRWGEFRCFGFEELPGRNDHVALVYGDPAAVSAPVVRLHSECLTGDVFGSLRCDCGAQLDRAMQLVVASGAGAIVYLRGHEGRGIGIANKLRAYMLQERGSDTVDANLELGLPVDSRDFTPAAAILRELGVERVRLVTNNPAKCAALVGCGIAVAERIALDPVATPHNLRYLEAKRERMGHLLDLPALDRAPR